MSVNFYAFSKPKTVASHDDMIELSTYDAANCHQVVKPNPFLMDKVISTCPSKDESRVKN
jgi:flagellar basal body-associated protein FliL